MTWQRGPWRGSEILRNRDAWGSDDPDEAIAIVHSHLMLVQAQHVPLDALVSTFGRIEHAMRKLVRLACRTHNPPPADDLHVHPTDSDAITAFNSRVPAAAVAAFVSMLGLSATLVVCCPGLGNVTYSIGVSSGKYVGSLIARTGHMCALRGAGGARAATPQLASLPSGASTTACLGSLGVTPTGVLPHRSTRPTLRISLDTPVADLRRLGASETGLRPHEHRLVVDGMPLAGEGARTLWGAGAREGSVLRVVPYMCVGGSEAEDVEVKLVGGDLSGSGGDKWTGGVLAQNGKMYGIPCYASRVLCIDPATE